jgi:hypothetical protein
LQAPNVEIPDEHSRAGNVEKWLLQRGRGAGYIFRRRI